MLMTNASGLHSISDPGTSCTDCGCSPAVMAAFRPSTHVMYSFSVAGSRSMAPLLVSTVIACAGCHARLGMWILQHKHSWKSADCHHSVNCHSLCVVTKPCHTQCLILCCLTIADAYWPEALDDRGDGKYNRSRGHWMNPFGYV